MSQLLSIENELLAIVTTIDARFTSSHKRVGFIPFDQIPADAYPFAMTYDPAGAAERLDPYQLVDTLTFNLLLIEAGAPANVETAKLWVDDFRAQVAGDPTLNSLVDIAWVSIWAIDEMPEASRVVTLIQVTAERGV
jgi:hypothetical protein